MQITPLALDATLGAYDSQAGELLAAHRAGDREALELIHQRHPRFLDAEVKWLPLRVSEDEIRKADFTVDDARLVVARWYDFRDWEVLAAFVAAVEDGASAAWRFERAVDAVVVGDLDRLGALLAADAELVHARSARVTHFDPPVHRSTLLHYVAANGVEGYRQKTPANVVAVADMLLRAGADPDSLADLYGGKCTTMSLLVSSCHPAAAGVQVALVDKLVEYGASVEPLGGGNWASPLHTALVFGYRDAAEALVRHGARIADVADAAGLGRMEEVRRLLPEADGGARHRALALAAQLGHAGIVELLLDAGEDPDRFNPKGHHAHATPLHHAALAGHEDVVRLLVERGARIDVQDKHWHSTPLGWARHSGRAHVEKYLLPG